MTQKRLKVATYIMWGYYAFMLLSFMKEFEKHIVAAILFGSISLTLLIVVILSCFSLVILDFTNLIFLITRAIIAFNLFEAIKNKDAGFESTDLKPMQDCIHFIIFPSLLLCTINMKIELLATFPICIICIYYSYNNAYAIVGNNMDCYMQADVTAKNLFMRTLCMYFIIMFAIHDQRKTQIMHFIGQERSKK